MSAYDWVGIDQRYSISFCGQVRNDETGRILKTRIGAQGYELVNLYLDEGEKTVLVHRLLAAAFLGDFCEYLQVDHINGVRSDNSVKNLRMVTAAQNARGYRKPRKGASSQYRGVSRNKRINRWLSKMVIDGVETYIGVFKDEKDAARAFDKKALSVGYANEALNFPQ